jgi:ketosteroid isomerase-like protein
MAMPGFSITFAPSKVVIAKSGDMAYEIGTFQTTVNDAQGKPTSSVGKFVVNWQKRGGQWKVVADIFNDDK